LGRLDRRGKNPLGHGGKLPDFSSRWPRLTGWPLRRAARVIALSGYLADALRGFQHDIEILPNAISLESYPFRWRKSARTRLVWLRAFHDIYDPQLVIRTIALLTPQFQVEFGGWISKNAVAATIDSGDIFLNTSKIDVVARWRFLLSGAAKTSSDPKKGIYT
jgi:hypothetical protein